MNTQMTMDLSSGSARTLHLAYGSARDGFPKIRNWLQFSISHSQGVELFGALAVLKRAESPPTREPSIRFTCGAIDSLLFCCEHQEHSFTWVYAHVSTVFYTCTAWVPGYFGCRLEI